MSYSYAAERSRLFTEEGQALVLATYERARRLIAEAGACSIVAMTKSVSFGDTDAMLAIADRLEELGYLRCVNFGPGTAGQHQIYVLGHKADRL